MTPPHVVVIGAGAIGLASAWRLAQRGVRVDVVDPDPGGGASGVAAGMLAPVTEARLGEEELLELGMASWARWPDFATELSKTTGSDLGYRADGTVVVALDADDRAVLADVADRQRVMGLEVDELAVAELRRLEPALAPAVRRGVRAAGERAVDPPALVGALLAAAEAADARVRIARVTGVTLAHDGAVSGVELDGGERLAADVVVLAAGTWSSAIDRVRGAGGGLPSDAIPPVRPVKGQVVTLRQRPGDVLVHHTVRGYVRGSVVYLVPREDGRVVCGATVEERGWDTTITAGGAYQLLRDVLTLFPGLDDAEFTGMRAGFRPGTPDDLPLIGHTSVDGLIMATGHYRNGILLTPLTAEAVAALVTGSGLPDEVGVCDPKRFAATSSRRAGPNDPPASARDPSSHQTQPRPAHTARGDPGANPAADLRSVALPQPGHTARPGLAATPSSGITVVVNGEDHTVEAGVSLDELVSALELDRQGLAIAVDDEVVPRSGWAAHRLTDSSRVEILSVAQGG